MIAGVVALFTLFTDPRAIDLKQTVDTTVAELGFGVRISEVYYVHCGYTNAWYHGGDEPRLTICEELGRESLGYQRFVIAHELAHAVIDQFDLPITGSEEDAADEFATLILLATGHDDDIVDAAAAYWRDGTPEVPTDTHSGDLRRGYNIMCLRDGASMSPVSDDCQSRFEHAARTWTRLLRTE